MTLVSNTFPPFSHLVLQIIQSCITKSVVSSAEKLDSSVVMVALDVFSFISPLTFTQSKKKDDLITKL
jgi:hypothetical protein